MNLDELTFDSQGLIPGVVQDAATGRVLMVAYLNKEAIARSAEVGEVHFWSRSRGEMWHKGATSGNRLDLVEMMPDCDGDALLLAVRPQGPACHTGEESCFPSSRVHAAAGFARLDALWDTILRRAAEMPPGSYTAELIAGGVDQAGRKVLEESGELLIAAKDHVRGGSDGAVAEEAADLIYHLLVLLAERGVPAEDVLAVLEERAR